MNHAKDLVVLVADKDAEQVIGALLTERVPSLHIRPVRFDIFRHPRKDPGVLLEAHDFLRPFQRHYRRALVVFDHEGSGRESIGASEVEEELQARLDRAGWQGRSAIVVISPELEIWMWASSPHVATAFGWENYARLKEWIEQRGMWPSEATKPDRPKEAIQSALRQRRISWSSAIFAEITRRVSLARCHDGQFNRLKGVLGEWFGLGDTHE